MSENLEGKGGTASPSNEEQASEASKKSAPQQRSSGILRLGTTAIFIIGLFFTVKYCVDTPKRVVVGTKKAVEETVNAAVDWAQKVILAFALFFE